MLFVSGPCGALQTDAFREWLGTLGTLAGVAVALRVYLASERDKRKAQARRVSCHVNVPVLRRAPGFEWTPGGELIVTGDKKNEDYAPSKEGDPKERLVLDEPAMEFLMPFANLSDEELSEVTCDLLDKDGNVLQSSVIVQAICPPTFERTFRYMAHRHFDTDRETCKLRLRFTDATGRCWERVSGEPVRKIKSYRFEREDKVVLKAHLKP